MFAAAAIVRTLQCVAFGGVSYSVISTTCLIFSAVSGLSRGGRVASFSRPSTPLATYRRRQRRTVSTLLPTDAAIDSLQPSRRPQYDPCPPYQLLRRIPVTHQIFQPLTISIADR